MDNKITLRANTDIVILDVTPRISESRTTNFVDAPAPSVSAVVVYESTQGRKWSINARLISRTVEEANKNFKYMNILKSWMVPKQNSGALGVPPVVTLSGYKAQFYDVTTQMTSLNIDFPDNVDYIETSKAHVPIIQNITITLTEKHEPEDRASFNLTNFKRGLLRGF
jgi:hypothetical protein